MSSATLRILEFGKALGVGGCNGIMRCTCGFQAEWEKKKKPVRYYQCHSTYSGSDEESDWVQSDSGAFEGCVMTLPFLSSIHSAESYRELTDEVHCGRISDSHKDG